MVENAAKKSPKTNVKKKKAKVKASKPKVSQKPSVKEAKKTDEKEITQKAREKDHKKKFWQVVSFALTAIAIVLIITLITMLFTNSENQTPTGENVDNNLIAGQNANPQLVIIEDPQCLICNTDYFAEQVKQNLMPDLEITKIDYTENEAQLLLNIAGVPFLPLYIFDDKITQRPDWEQMSSSFLPLELNERTFYVLDSSAVPYKVAVNEIPILENAVVIGDENAPVTVYAFSDYECEFCAVAEGNEALVSEFSQRYPGYEAPIPKVFENYVEEGKVKYIFYNFPVSSQNPQSLIAHNAALCANEQGMWKEFHKMLFDSRSDWINSGMKKDKFNKYAQEIGIDLEDFSLCQDEMRYQQQIASEIQLGILYGAMGTPSFFINKNFVPGAQEYSIFSQIIELELNR